MRDRRPASESGAPNPPAWLALESGERMTLRAAPSRKLLLGAFGLSFVLLVGLSILVGRVDDVGTGRRLSWVAVVLTVGTILFAFYSIRRREYVVTNRRVVVGVGVLSKDVEEVSLDRVEDVVVDRSPVQRWLGTGTVRLETETARSLALPFVERPHVVSERILPLLESGRS